MNRRRVNAALIVVGAVAITLSLVVSSIRQTEAQSTAGLPGAPTGLCCFVGANCSEETEFDCILAGGTWAGPGTAIDGLPLGGVPCDFTCGPLGDVCVFWRPPQNHGACCLPFGGCEFTTQCNCLGPSGLTGQFQGGGTACRDVDCPVGACETPIGTCLDNAADFTCCRLGGVWHEGLTCEDVKAGPCPDINGDNVVDVIDLIRLLLCFGQPAVPVCEVEDINLDGTVNVLDLIDLLLAFGTTCP